MPKTKQNAYDNGGVKTVVNTSNATPAIKIIAKIWLDVITLPPLHELLVDIPAQADYLGIRLLLVQKRSKGDNYSKHEISKSPLISEHSIGLGQHVQYDI